jgi:flagellar motility protein MotE (MotC chaperone)
MKNTNKIIALGVFLVVTCQARPAYSIPTSLDDLSESVKALCRDYGLEFCAGPPKDSAGDAPKKREFTETEKQILSRLVEQSEQIKQRETDLSRREAQFKALQEDIQRQISQLEKLQKKIADDISKKKSQDQVKLDKAVSFYAKMDAATAAQSIARLDQSTAVRILIRMKDKQASEVLANMGPDKSAELIAKITNK